MGETSGAPPRHVDQGRASGYQACCDHISLTDIRQAVYYGLVITRQLGYELRLAELAWRKNLEGPLRRLGLTIPQYSTLRALERAPGASSAELARSALVTPQTMNALVLQLEQDQLITRTTSTTNLRVLNAELTPSGKALLTKATRLVRRLESAAVTDLSEAEHRQLLDLLMRCTATLERGAPGHALST